MLGMGKCKHFTGLQNRECTAGVNYRSVRVILTPEQQAATGSPVPACWPCSPHGLKAGLECDRRELPTAEEVAAAEAEATEFMRKVLAAECPKCGGELTHKTDRFHRSTGCVPCNEVFMRGRLSR